MIIVASYPKSGATWFQFLMHGCRFGQIYYSSVEVGEYYYTAKSPKTAYLNRLKRGDLFFQKTHFAYCTKVPFLESAKYYIYLARNPLDVLASKANHFELTAGKRELSKEDYHQLFKKEIDKANDPPSDQNNFAGGWNFHVTSWIKNPKKVPVYTIKYEDLLEDSLGTMIRLNKDLRLGFTEANITKGCALASFENMSKIEKREMTGEIAGKFFVPKRKQAYVKKGVRFVNKGASNYYSEVLDDNIIQEAKLAFQTSMRLLGY